MRHGVQVSWRYFIPNITLHVIVSLGIACITWYCISLKIPNLQRSVISEMCNKIYLYLNFYPSVLDSDHNGYLDFKVICHLAMLPHKSELYRPLVTITGSKQKLYGNQDTDCHLNLNLPQEFQQAIDLVGARLPDDRLR